MRGDLLICNIQVTLNFDFNEKVFYMLQAINQSIFFHLCNLASLGIPGVMGQKPKYIVDEQPIYHRPKAKRDRQNYLE